MTETWPLKKKKQGNNAIEKMFCHDLLSLVWLQDSSRTRGLSFLSHGEAMWVDESVFAGKYKA